MISTFHDTIIQLDISQTTDNLSNPFFEAKMESFCVVFMIMDQENWIVVAWTMKNSQGPEESLNN